MVGDATDSTASPEGAPAAASWLEMVAGGWAAKLVAADSTASPALDEPPAACGIVSWASTLTLAAESRTCTKQLGSKQESDDESDDRSDSRAALSKSLMEPLSVRLKLTTLASTLTTEAPAGSGKKGG